MTIWSDYMRATALLIKSRCTTCDGFGQHAITQPEASDAEKIIGAAMCEVCGGTGYEKPPSREWMKGYDKAKDTIYRRNKSGCCCKMDDEDKIVSVCNAHRELGSRTLRDYSTSELMVEYMRRDGCG